MSILPSKQLTILHISDLHLVPGDIVGERGWRKLWKALSNKLILKESGWERLWESFSDGPEQKHVDLCVISGDLPRHSPRKKLYKALRADLDGRFPPCEGKRRWIAVPGNHDRKILGNLFLDTKTFEKNLDGKWRDAWWDEKYPCIVVPLDSNPKAAAPLRAGVTLSRGVLGHAECKHMADEFARVKECVVTKFSEALAAKPARETALCAMGLHAAFEVHEIKELRRAAYPRMGELPAESVPRELIKRIAEVLSCLYMARAVRCVVFHHHPIGVRSEENVSLTRQDAYELLADSGSFLQAARENQISLVLHGHKHTSHRIAVYLPEKDPEVVGIVGAGSSTQRSKYESATANLITINEAGEVYVELHDSCAHDCSRQPAKVRLRDWSHVRKHLHAEAAKLARYSAKDAQFDVTVLPDGDAIWTVQMRGVRFRRDPGQPAAQVLEIPIGYESGTQIGPVQVTCQIEEQDHGLQQVVFHPYQEPGYGPGEWHGCVRIEPTDPEQPTSLTVTIRVMLFTAFAMNSWQAGFMYANNEMPWKEQWSWGFGTPIREQVFVGLETTGDRASALTFDRLYSIYERIDGCVDEQERQEMVVDLTATKQRVAFTVPMPVWGSRYGIGWEWGNQSRTKGQNAPVFTGLREQLEIEARQARAGGPLSPLRSDLQELLRKGSLELEATLHVLTRPSGDDAGKLIQIAANPAAGYSLGYEFEMNFGAGVAGRAASLQKTTAWVAKDGGAPSEEALIDFYLRGPRNYGHTGVLAIPIPERQPLAILSIASRENDDFSDRLREILKPGNRNRAKADAEFKGKFAWISGLAEDIGKVLDGAQAHAVGSERPTSNENHTSSQIASHKGAEREVFAPGVAQAESRPWDDAITPVNPDKIQQRLKEFEINFHGDASHKGTSPKHALPGRRASRA